MSNVISNYRWSNITNGLSTVGKISGITSALGSPYVYACDYNSATTPIYISSDGGYTWSSTASSPSINRCNAIACSTNGLIVAAIGNSSECYISINSGLTWTIVNNVQSNDVLFIAMTSDGTYALIGGHNGSSLAQYINISSGPPYTAVTVSDPNNYTGSARLKSMCGYNTGFIIGSELGVCRYLIGGSVSLISSGTGSFNSATVSCDPTGIYIVASTDGKYTSKTLSTSTTIPLASSLYSSVCFYSSGGTNYFALAGRYNSTNPAIWLSYDSGGTFSQVINSLNNFTNLNIDGNQHVFGAYSNYKQINILGGISAVTGNYGIYMGNYNIAICFKEGSKILCLIDEQEIYVPVETITPGTLVKTRLDGYKPVALIGTSKLYNSGDDIRGSRRLYKLTQEHYPELIEDLVLTGCHCILTETITDEERSGIVDIMKNVYVTDCKYRLPTCVDQRAVPYEKEGVFPIWHLALEHDDIFMNYGIYANGLLVESTSKRMISLYSGMKMIGN